MLSFLVSRFLVSCFLLSSQVDTSALPWCHTEDSTCQSAPYTRAPSTRHGIQPRHRKELGGKVLVQVDSTAYCYYLLQLVRLVQTGH